MELFQVSSRLTQEEGGKLIMSTCQSGYTFFNDLEPLKNSIVSRNETQNFASFLSFVLYIMLTIFDRLPPLYMLCQTFILWTYRDICTTYSEDCDESYIFE